jgi:hypothetical protein
MNAERLHAIANELKAELTASETPALMQQLIENLQAVVQNPTAPEPQQTLSSTRQQLEERLKDAPSNSWSPAWTLALDELGVADVVGDRLRERIEAVFDRNTITPSAAVDELNPIATRLAALDNALDQVMQGFQFFEIGAEVLEPGEFEVGFLIPRTEVANDIGNLGAEFRRIKGILGPFLELATGSRPDVAVRSISSSEFQVLLYGIPGATLMLAKALDYLVSAYQKVIEMREGRQKLKDAGASEETLKMAGRDADNTMGKEIDALVETLLAEADARIDEARRNELRKELQDSLSALARRIDRGYVMEVRAGKLPAPPDENEDGEAPPDDERIREIADQILQMQARLNYSNLTGEPILQLPEAIDDDDVPDGTGGARGKPGPA